MEESSFDYRRRYLEIHSAYPKWFSGQISCRHADIIADLVREMRAARLLDYGSGKGYQYLRDRIHERWGGILPHCYDIGVRQLSTRPEGRFDGVICTDVLEHIAEDDLDWHLRDMIGFIDEGFLFLNISVRPAGKEFSDGTNMHLTVRPPWWWEELLAKYQRSGLIIRAEYENKCCNNL